MWSGTIVVGTVTDPHASKDIGKHLFFWQSVEWTNSNFNFYKGYNNVEMMKKNSHDWNIWFPP